MEDRYLYRGKRLDNGEWISGSLIHNAFVDAETREPRYYIFNCDTSDSDCFEDMSEGLEYFCVDPSTVGQCIGLRETYVDGKYKQGDLLFVDDVVTISTYSYGEPIADYYGVLDADCFGFYLRTIDNAKIYLSDIIPGRYAHYSKHGNVHDNPELMEEEQ